MILLDSDHLTVLRYPENPRCASLSTKLQASITERLAITIISIEEQMRGWLAKIHSLRDVHGQVDGYDLLIQLFDVYIDWEIVRFDIQAADMFKWLKSQRVRIGTSDLKIASIALVHDALLLTANRRDFERVPGLRFENWLE